MSEGAREFLGFSALRNVLRPLLLLPPNVLSFYRVITAELGYGYTGGSPGAFRYLGRLYCFDSGFSGCRHRSPRLSLGDYIRTSHSNLEQRVL